MFFRLLQWILLMVEAVWWHDLLVEPVADILKRPWAGDPVEERSVVVNGCLTERCLHNRRHKVAMLIMNLGHESLILIGVL
jgi:hypothetical protein